MFSNIINKGIEKIYSEDLNSQKHYIDTIAKDVRNMNPEVLYRMKAFFVPNETYMLKYFGEGITDINFDCYTSYGNCSWVGFLVIPVKDLVGRIVGLTGFNPYNKLLAKENPEEDVYWYKVSGKSLFDKSKFIFMADGVYKKALEDGYIIITDGNFDMINLYDNGFNSGCLLGSYVSDIVIAMLSCIDVVYIAMDNDDAGVKLYKYLSSRLPNVYIIKQNIDKDIDGALKSPYKEDLVNKMRNHIFARNKYNFFYNTLNL